MNAQQKIIKNKLGLLNLTETLGSVSKACSVMAIPETVFTVSKSCMKPEAKLPYGI